MPDAKIDAKTSSRIDPRAKQACPGGTAVTLAAQRNDAESIALLGLGADLDARDDNGGRPAPRSVENAVNAIEALLGGRDPNIKDDRDGSTAVILAAYGMRRAALDALIDKHPAVDLTLRDVGNATVAGHCAQRGLCEESREFCFATRRCLAAAARAEGLPGQEEAAEVSRC